MSLADDLAELRVSKPRTFGQWLDIADNEDVEIVLAAIADRTLPANALAVTLSRNGIPITRDTIVKRRESAK